MQKDYLLNIQRLISFDVPETNSTKGDERSRNLLYYCHIKLTARLIEVNFNPFLSYILYKFKINKFHVF